jgi:hypothetical protein
MLGYAADWLGAYAGRLASFLSELKICCIGRANPFFLLYKLHSLVSTSNDHGYHKRRIYIQAKIHSWKVHYDIPWFISVLTM